MQKSKNFTFVIIFLILIYGIIASVVLTTKLNFIYLYIINPLFYIAIAILLRILLGKQINSSKITKKSKEYAAIGALAYIIISLLLGLIVTFGKNPYSKTLLGILTNIWIFGSVVVAKEYIRYKLINNVYEKDKIKMAVLISIVYVIVDMNINRFITENISVVFVVKQIFQNILPLIVKNVLFSYIAIYADFRASIIYQLIIDLYLWLCPVLPNLNWMMSSILEISVPIVLFMYLQYLKTKNSIYKSKEDLLRSDPRNAIPVVVVVVLAMWFALGLFPIKPVSIASGSMLPEIHVGDVVLIKKCNPNDIIVGDIIQYQMEGYTVIHRVIEKKQKNGEYIFITKGDNNKSADSKPVYEDQVIGKCILKIRYLGYPAIWLHLIQTEEELQVDTGNN